MKENEQEIYLRYSLAHLLIPERDVADDLFMDARSTEDVRRRARTWMRAQGLTPVDTESLDLPELSPDEKEHALHLARRGRLRRAIRWGGGGLAALSVIATLLFFPQADMVSRLIGQRGIAADAVFNSDRVVASERIEERTFSVYRSEATPLGIKVWWVLIGPNSRSLERQLRPGIRLSTRQRWIAPATTVTQAPRPDKLYGVSTYQSFSGNYDQVSIQVEGLSSGRPMVLMVPVEWTDYDPKARVIQVNRGTENPVTSFSVSTITLASEYTLMEYTGPRWTITSPIVPQMMEVEVDGAIIPWRGSRRLEIVGDTSMKVQDILDPIPAGTTRLTLRYPTRMYKQESQTFMITDTEQVKDLVHAQTGQIRATLNLSPEVRFLDRARFVDSRGTEYAAEISAPGLGSSQSQSYTISARSIPFGTSLTGIRLLVGTPIPPIILELELPD